MNLKNLIALVVSQRVALAFRFLLLHVSVDRFWIRQLYVAVEPCHLQLADVVLGLTHDVRDTLGGLGARRSIRNNNILCRDVHRHLTAQ